MTNQFKSGAQILITKSIVLARGWTKKLMHIFLHAPDEQKTNPHYRRAGKMQLFSFERVLRMEQTPEFIRAAGEKRITKIAEAPKTYIW